MIMSRMFVYYLVFFFFKQKTAYEMRISDWSSDVCSSDLVIETVDAGRGFFRHALDRIDGARKVARLRLEKGLQRADELDLLGIGWFDQRLSRPYPRAPQSEHRDVATVIKGHVGGKVWPALARPVNDATDIGPVVSTA